MIHKVKKDDYIRIDGRTVGKQKVVLTSVNGIYNLYIGKTNVRTDKSLDVINLCLQGLGYDISFIEADY